MAGFFVVLLGFWFLLALVAIGFILAGIIVSAVFAAGARGRAARGETLGAKKAIPIVLFILGLIPLTLVIGAVIFIAVLDAPYKAQRDISDRAYAYVHSHDAEGLARMLDSQPGVAVGDPSDQRAVSLGQSLLDLAIKEDDPSTAKVLLDRGVTPDGNDLRAACNWEDGGASGPHAESTLQSGKDTYNPQLVSVLLDAGAPAGEPTDRPPINSFVVSMCGNGIDDTDMAILRRMLQQGASISAVDGGGWRAIDRFNEVLGWGWGKRALAGQDDKVAEVQALLTPKG